MKKMWKEPSIQVQKFVPNEYVATCWQVACAVGNGDYGGYNWSYWGNVRPSGDQSNDHTGSCSFAVNNQFSVNENGSVTFVSESSSDQGTLTGGYTSYIDNNDNDIVDAGDVIFWYTTGSGNRRWNHYGTVVNISEDHPNRS